METTVIQWNVYWGHIGGCQNYGPVLDPYYNTAPNTQGTQKRDHKFDNHPYRGV